MIFTYSLEVFIQFTYHLHVVEYAFTVTPRFGLRARERRGVDLLGPGQLVQGFGEEVHGIIHKSCLRLCAQERKG